MLCLRNRKRLLLTFCKIIGMILVTKPKQGDMKMKNAIHIKEVQEREGKDVFITDTGSCLTQEEVVALARTVNTEITYDEEFSRPGDMLSIDQGIDRGVTTFIEVTHDDGFWDVYIHEVKSKYGEVTYDFEGQFKKAYKTENGAMNYAKKLGGVIF